MSNRACPVDVGKIEKWQQENRLNRTKLAEKFGCNRSTITRMFQTSRISMVFVEEAAKAMGTVANDLLVEVEAEVITAGSGTDWNRVSRELENRRGKTIRVRSVAAALAAPPALVRDVCESWCNAGKMVRQKDSYQYVTNS